MKKIELKELMVDKRGSIDPKKSLNEIFVLYSIPSYERKEPDILKGKDIGSSKKIIYNNDVILSRIVPHIRRAWIVNDNSGKQKIASGEWIIFNSENVNNEYLRHFLLSDRFNKQFLSTTTGVGGSLLRANPKRTGKIQIPLPPLPIQKKIAEVLDKADSLRQKRKEAIAKLDELAQSIFLDIFGDPSY